MINSHAQCEMIIIIKNNDVSRVIVFVKLVENDLHDSFPKILKINKLDI